MLLEFVKIGLTLWPTWILLLGLHAMVYKYILHMVLASYSPMFLLLLLLLALF